jgi:superfamily II DNA helicase RecQ
MKRCRIAHVKPFQVLANKTLEELAAQKPATLQELQQISGIGPVKLAQYGEELLRLIQG